MGVIDLYPVVLQLSNKKVVVVGGGSVAYRKIRGLLQKGAQIVVVSPQLNTNMQELWRTENIEWLQRAFQQSDVDGAFLVFAATNSKEVNAFVASSCRPEQIVNICDDSNASSFHVPAVYQRSHLTIAVSTDGISPLLAKKVRDDVSKQYDNLTDDYFIFLQKVRHIVKNGPFTALEKRNHLLEALNERYEESLGARSEFINKLNFLKQKVK